MTISQAQSARYIEDADTSQAVITGPTIRLDMINSPCFCLSLGLDNTTAGEILYEESVNTDNNNASTFTELVWVEVFRIVVAAGLFPNGQKGYLIPNSNAAPLPNQWQTSAQACRLRFRRSTGGSVKQLNVAYFGKSQG